LPFPSTFLKLFTATSLNVLFDAIPVMLKISYLNSPVALPVK